MLVGAYEPPFYQCLCHNQYLYAHQQLWLLLMDQSRFKAYCLQSLFYAGIQQTHIFVIIALIFTVDGEP